MSDSCKICRLTIAGPGAGKTTRMVDIIEECISNVAPNRFIAVITYTNEATKEIQNKLKNRIELPNNLFIGTIHSFLIKFVFESYAHLFDIVSIDKCYIDKIKEFNAEYKDELVTKNGKKGATKIELNYFYKKSEEILESGFVTYDKILEKSHKLILNEKICAIVSNKLQYIFIDEYQDSRYYQHEIIMQILSKGSTSIYAIGDPMQSIFYFSYSTSQLKNELIPESFDEFPINM